MVGWILDQRSQDPTSNLGPSTGWSSHKELFRHGPWPDLIRFIFSRLEEREENWKPEISGWANVMKKGDVLLEHDHVKSHLGDVNEFAGVYFLQIPPGSSRLTFKSPGPGLVRDVPAEEGLLVLFPAAEIHSVPLQVVDGIRITISFNVRKATVS